MSDPIRIVDEEDAQDFLKSCFFQTQQLGEVLFRQGRTSDIRQIKAGTEFLVTVIEGDIFNVQVRYDKEVGWATICNCPEQSRCRHGYAAMKALLAEDSLAAVRGISSGVIAPPPSTAPQPAKKAEKKSVQTLAVLATEALKRRLTREEASYCKLVNDIYIRCSASRRIARWDFDELGLPLHGNGWEIVKIWPSFPESQHEFWLYVANAAMESGGDIPKFLEPITDLAPVKERLEHWRRGQEVSRWKNMLGNVSIEHVGAAAREYDLRLVLRGSSAEVECKRPGQEKFSPIKTTPFRQLSEECRSGLATLPPEAEVLCQIVAVHFTYGYSSELNYTDNNIVTMLGKLLRMRSLESRIVNADGQVITRAAQPLRWAVAAAENQNEDYRFRLVQFDGSAPPPILCVIDGQPSLIVTRDAIFTGPLLHDNILNPLVENAVPAAAVETHVGLNFLQSLGVELPPRLRERVRHVPLNVAISCELKPVFPGSKGEICLFNIVAESADGAHQERWDGLQWHNGSSTPAKKNDQLFTLYERSVAQQVPTLLAPLELKFDTYLKALTLRVTKKFPDAFVPWLKTVPPQITVHLKGELASLANASVSGSVRLEVNETAIDWFDLSVVLDMADTTLTPEEVQLLLKAKGSYVRLGDKGWRKLEFNLTDEDDEHLANLGLNPHELTSEPQRLHALQLAHQSAKKFLPTDQAEQIQRRATEIMARVTPDLPKGVKAELRPYQLEGFHFLAYLSTNRFGGILADDMGLGKTVQTLAWLLWLREQRTAANPPPPCLVVCPKSVMDNWSSEAEKFTPGLRVKNWPPSELDTLVDRLGEADVHVLNYNQLRSLSEDLAPVQWLAVILDEGQYIKNPSSQTTQAARALRAEHRLVLSGTPIENRLLDLWSLMSFSMPGILSSRRHFSRLYDGKGDPFARRRLASRVRPFLLRRTKTQVAKDLPDRVEEDLFCEIEGEQKTLYRAELKRAQQLLLKVQTQTQLNKDRFNFLTSLLRLRQICCHPALVNPESKTNGAKMDALLEQIEPLMEEGHKVLVFSQFVELLGLLKPAIQERGWTMFYLAGETENRGKLVKDFQAAEGGAVFLISLKAGGFGLNLTAASYVVLFDPWWNPAVENQAIDRTHRIGQVNKVIAYRLLIKDSVEEKIRALQKQKSALALDVLGEEKFSQSLSIEDLQFLLAD